MAITVMTSLTTGRILITTIIAAVVAGVVKEAVVMVIIMMVVMITISLLLLWQGDYYHIDHNKPQLW